jgi:hypothetical protein
MSSQPPNRPSWSSRRRLRRARLRSSRRAATGIAHSYDMATRAPSLGDHRETGNDNLVTSASQLSRLIRVRISRENGTVFSAINTPDTNTTDIDMAPVSFEGPLATLRSEISMVFSRDLLYFDEQIPLTWAVATRGLLDASYFRTRVSPITRVALHLTRIPKDLLCPLWMSVDGPYLSHLFLVCDGDALRPLAEGIPSGKWGFRPISETEAKERQPQIRELISSAFETFKAGSPALGYSFVFDWEGRGRYRD